MLYVPTLKNSKKIKTVRCRSQCV